MPSVIGQLQDINNAEINPTPLDMKELRSTVKLLKNSKHKSGEPSDYVKHAMEC